VARQTRKSCRLGECSAVTPHGASGRSR
jgi:hypothetical protein